MCPVRTRFAPSPTGFLHLGSTRTALFNWAFARHHQGEFLLRIEDTDQERSTKQFEEMLIAGLEWLGLDWDEGPYRQSERRGRHTELIDQLLASNRAYRCVCSRESLEERRARTIATGAKWVGYDGRCRDANLGPDSGSHVVRLRLAEVGKLGWDDLVFGPSGQETAEIGDMIIRRSDGSPLYNFAVVVDDRDMGISHVIRGADLQNNTTLQLAIYRALDWAPPLFAHVPLIVNKSGKKLSKRRDPISVQSYRDQGILPQALRNWLLRLGWSHGDQEIFSAEEIVRLFDLDNVGRSSAQADPDKLLWLNHHYIKALPLDELYPALEPYLVAQAGRPVERDDGIDRLVDLLRDRSKTLVEMAERARWILVDVIQFDEKAASKHLTAAARPVLEDLHARLTDLSDWNESVLEGVFEGVRGEHQVAMGVLAQPVRVAVTGGTASPGIFETLAVLGQKRSLMRIAEAVRFIGNA